MSPCYCFWHPYFWDQEAQRLFRWCLVSRDMRWVDWMDTLLLTNLLQCVCIDLTSWTHIYIYSISICFPWINIYLTVNIVYIFVSQIGYTQYWAVLGVCFFSKTLSSNCGHIRKITIPCFLKDSSSVMEWSDLMNKWYSLIVISNMCYSILNRLHTLYTNITTWY